MALAEAEERCKHLLPGKRHISEGLLQRVSPGRSL